MTLSDLASDLYEHFLALPQFRPRPRLLAGHTAVVTGSTPALAWRPSSTSPGADPSRLVLACRDAAKGEAAKPRLVGETGLEAGRVEVGSLDLGRFASVQAFAKRCEEERGRLDLLVQNAGLQTFD